ncbi:acyl-CoA thioesterase 9, tandem duplicate 1 isoform X1 [Latimeria chalumnae]|uniref:acyl-CoA thioesterase 9, tandem duplicate 1 isoform X1 n=1 Tax=Latimeria chalumnae TaxID=7897 RepID=UPI00313EDF5F
MLLIQRFHALSSAPSIVCRTLSLTSNLSAEARPPDMNEGQSNIHMNNVRDKLRELVGASTNWSDHIQAMKDRVSLSSLLAARQEDLPPRRMKDSHIEVLLPLGSQPLIREKYLNVHNFVRFGRILEDLDSLGVLVCYTHTKKEGQRSPLSIVTAMVDKIDMRKNVIYPDRDVKFTGNVTWAGKTSMEITIHMFQYHDGACSPVLEATFVMVARDPENKKAAFVNPLIPEGPEEEALFQRGEMNKKRRVETGSASLLKMAPTQEERNVIHNIFLNTLDTKTVSFHSRYLPPNSVWMEDAKLKGLEICHPKERNIFNRIFGGFLMRKAYELGWANACTYGGSRPYLVAVDDIMFRKPVEVGSLLYLSSQICYTTENYIQVRVHTEVCDPGTGQHATTNVFHFTFCSEKEIPQIIPKTYGESMLYLDGKRHFDAVVKAMLPQNHTKMSS